MILGKFMQIRMRKEIYKFDNFFAFMNIFIQLVEIDFAKMFSTSTGMCVMVYPGNAKPQ